MSLMTIRCRRLVYSRPGHFSPVNGNQALDKPDRVMKGIIERAGFDTVSLLLQTLPEVRARELSNRFATHNYSQSQTKPQAERKTVLVAKSVGPILNPF